MDRLEVENRMAKALCEPPESSARRHGGRPRRTRGRKRTHVTPMYEQKELPMAPVRPQAIRRETHALHRGMTIVIHNESVSVFTQELCQGKRSKRPNVLVVVSRDEIVDKRPDLCLGRPQESISLQGRQGI